jgi:hypothetical protein
VKCGTVWHLGDGFLKVEVEDCIKCTPEKYGKTAYYGNPIKEEHGTHVVHFFTCPKQYWVSAEGLHLIIENGKQNNDKT